MPQEPNWKDYYKKTIGIPPRPILVSALPHVRKKGLALDIGAGALNDSRYLLKQGFDGVVAVDPAGQFVEISKSISDKHFSAENTSIQKYDFRSNTFDIVNAGYSLPFISPEDFMLVWYKIYNSLKDGGIFCGQLFGEHDDWSSNTSMTFQSRKDIQNLLSRFEVIEFTEEEKDEMPAVGKEKHWHLFHFILKKN